MKGAELLLSAVLALAAAPLLAHTHLESASPADGAVLNAAPATLELAFGEAVQLLKVDVATAAGAAQDIDFAPAAAASKTFAIALPALAPATYTVNWTVLGADGHRVEGHVGFTVDPAATAAAGTEHVEHHGH